MNHDGKTDLVGVYDGPTITMQVYISNGDGTFTKGQTTYPYNPNQSGFLDGLLAGDFDGDGKPDVAIQYSQEGPTSVQVWYGDGAGNLGSPFLIHDPNNYEDSLTVADINNDGKDDLIGSAFIYGVSGTSQFFPTSVTFIGNANRTLTYGTLTTGGCASIPTVADFNGDGLNDLAYYEGPCQPTSPSVTMVVRPGPVMAALAQSRRSVRAPTDTSACTLCAVRLALGLIW